MVPTGRSVSTKSLLSTLFNVSRANTIRKNSTLVVSEPFRDDAFDISFATCSALTAAKKLHDGPVSLLVMGSEADITKLEWKDTGFQRVLVASCPSPSPLAEHVAEAVCTAQRENGFTHVVTAASKFGSSFLPRAAAILGVSPITDVIEIIDDETFVRPMYAGNALAKVHSVNAVPHMISVRPSAFDVATANNNTVDVKALASNGVACSKRAAKWVSEITMQSSSVNLGSAPVVVSGGRGLKSGENFTMLEILAERLGGAVGATRAAVDSGMVSNDRLVGQTGKVVAPELYIAVGISGAIQHLSGMKDSGTIVAINTDLEAPIFQVADYGLHADLFEAVPELTEKI